MFASARHAAWGAINWVSQTSETDYIYMKARNLWEGRRGLYILGRILN